jgi:hypothetical protein
MEFCWHFLRKKIRQLCNMTELLCGPKRALSPEKTAVRPMATQKARVEWDLLRCTEWITEEVNGRVVDNRLKDAIKNHHKVPGSRIKLDSTNLVPRISICACIRQWNPKPRNVFGKRL